MGRDGSADRSASPPLPLTAGVGVPTSALKVLWSGVSGLETVPWSRPGGASWSVLGWDLSVQEGRPLTRCGRETGELRPQASVWLRGLVCYTEFPHACPLVAVSHT